MRDVNILRRDSAGFEPGRVAAPVADPAIQHADNGNAPVAQFASHGIFAMESEGVEEVVTLGDALRALPFRDLPRIELHGHPPGRLHFPGEDKA
jgi:hypothetical protein